MTEKFIKSLEQIKNPDIRVKSDLTSWKAKATNLISRIYGDDSRQEKQINQISYEDHIGFNGNSMYTSGNNASECEKRISDLIGSIIIDIQEYGISEQPIDQKSSSGINISINQNQTVNVQLIWDSFKDQLNENQQKEIKEIVESKEDIETKRNKIFEKLKSFGADLTSNVLANILTNPGIFG